MFDTRRIFNFLLGTTVSSVRSRTIVTPVVPLARDDDLFRTLGLPFQWPLCIRLTFHGEKTFCTTTKTWGFHKTNVVCACIYVRNAPRTQLLWRRRLGGTRANFSFRRPTQFLGFPYGRGRQIPRSWLEINPVRVKTIFILYLQKIGVICFSATL